MKKIVSIILVIAMAFSFAGCAKKEEVKCSHEYVAQVKEEGGNATVVLTCKKCNEVASAAVAIPTKTETVEKIVEVPVEVEKQVVKTVIKEVVKEVVKEVEVPADKTYEQLMEEIDYEYLEYYINNYSKLDSIKNYLLEKFYTDVDDETLMEGVYKGLFEALGDKYSEYIPPAESDDYYDAISNSYSGIGITMSADENNNVIVESVTVSGPAEAAGVLPGDMIIAVDGSYIFGMGLDAASLIRGETGTSVVITVVRNGSPIEFKITRRQVGMPSVDYSILDSGIGYISISCFDSVTNAELEAGLKYLESHGCTSFVLDLRNNGGGDVDVAIKVADQLMNEGVICYVEDRQHNKDYYRTHAGRTSMKYAVLVNGNTASASEIVCAGIQDNNEGKIVGTKTYGKGLIQILAYVNDGSSIKVTQYQYFSPNGNEINEIGIKPDYVVELTDDCFDAEGYLIYDAQLNKAVEILR